MFAGAADLAGQAGVIRGRVVRADGPVALSDAEVVLTGSGAATRTDALGQFQFREVVPGQVEIAVRRPGFATALAVVRVDPFVATEVQILLEPIAARLDPVVTSATRDARSLADVAAAVSVADSSAINRGATVGLHEPLRMMPGVQVASRYGTDDVNIGIRGSAARARQAVRGVAVLMDGVPVTEPDGVGRLDMIELAAARQVEVVRGPASALHAGSPGGVVNIVSRTGRDSPGLNVRAQRGAFGFYKYDGRAGALLAGGRGSAFGSGSYTSVEGYRAHSDATVVRGQVALDYSPDATTRLTFETVASRLDSRLPGSLSQADFDTTPRAAALVATTAGTGRGGTRYRVGSRVEKRTGTAAADMYFFYGGRTLDFPIPSQIVDLNLHRLQGGGRFHSARVAALPLSASLGFDYDEVFGTDQRWANVAGSRGALSDDGRFELPGIGTFAQAVWQTSAAITTTAGLRYDRVTYRFASETPGRTPRGQISFAQTSPRMAAVWRPDLATSLYASVGRGIEVPAIGELSASPGAPIRSVRPKSLWNYEVGARRAAGNRLLVEGAAFLAHVRGEFVPATVNGVSIPENASRSRNTGVELGITALATRSLDLGASYTFLDMRLQEYRTVMLTADGARVEVDFSGKRMPAVPRHRITGEARIRAHHRLSVDAQVEWQGLVYVETSNARQGVWYVQAAPGAAVQQVPFRAVAPRTLAHVNASFRAGSGALFGRVENLFGTRHAGNVVANELSGRFYDPGSPASASIGFSLGAR